MKSQIVYKDHRRKDMRIPTPELALLVDGRIWRTLDWSLGGFLLRHYRGHLKAGDRFEVRGIGGIGGALAPVFLRARVVRVERGGRLAAQFLGLSEAGFETLESLMIHRATLHHQPAHHAIP
ncbi:MAG: PilZ domain-containing protein [Magnetospirillum sp. WYHS-4]